MIEIFRKIKTKVTNSKICGTCLKDVIPFSLVVALLEHHRQLHSTSQFSYGVSTSPLQSSVRIKERMNQTYFRLFGGKRLLLHHQSLPDHHSYAIGVGRNVVEREIASNFDIPYSDWALKKRENTTIRTAYNTIERHSQHTANTQPTHSQHTAHTHRHSHGKKERKSERAKQSECVTIKHHFKRTAGTKRREVHVCWITVVATSRLDESLHSGRVTCRIVRARYHHSGVVSISIGSELLLGSTSG